MPAIVFGMDAEDGSVFERTVNGRSTTGLRLRRFISSLRARAPRCIGGSPLRAASPLTTGICTTHVTRMPPGADVR
jgi:hypothetical protein